jgi:hypothetical protein
VIERKKYFSKIVREKLTNTVLRNQLLLMLKIMYRMVKEGCGIVCLLAGVWQLKGIRRNADKGTFPLCLGEDDVK